MITLESGVGSTISSGGKTYLYFAGNDYLGLANHPAVTREAQRAIKHYGVGVSASRITTGTTDIHLRLEEELAGFKRTEKSIIFASGFLGNKLLLEALKEKYTAIFADSMSHPSIIEGVPKGKVKVHTYDHCNIGHLATLLDKYKNDQKLIITDGIFALTGEIAPLDKLYELALAHNAIIIVDDAHATGVLGNTGCGTPEHFNLQNRNIIFQSETMSKSLGSYGGFIASNSEIIDKIRSFSSFYGASTSLPPAIAAASREAIKMIIHHPELRMKMKRNAEHLRRGVTELGFETTETVAPIIPLYFKEFETASSLSSFLEENGIIAPNVKYPVKTHSFIVRATVSASHTSAHIDQFLNTLKNWRDSMESAKIKNVLIEPVNIPLNESFKIATGTKYNIENVLLTVQLENGIEGYGEAAPLEPINGENQATVLATLKSCHDFLIGQDVANFRQISKHLKSVFWAQITARCAIEMALIDAFTKTIDIPLYKFLGGAEETLETDYTIDIVAPDVARANAEKLMKKGYRTIKTKVGKNLIQDIDRLLAIRQGAPGCKLMLDANQGYTAPQAVHFLNELEKNNIRPELFEQPVVKYDLMGMKFVKEHTSVPIAADESVFTSADAIRIVQTGCADLINIKLMKSGIVESLDIAAIARSANIGLMIGCMLETKLGLSCSVHLAAGIGGFSFIDLDPHLDPSQEPFAGGADFADPLWQLPKTKPGIGISMK